MPEPTTAPVADATPVGGPAGIVGSEPTAVEPTAAEPTAAEPTAEPTPEPTPTFASADDFGWDDWDGETGLPEEVQGWYDQFNTRFTQSRDELTRTHETALGEAQRQAESYERLYNIAMAGGEDPRVAEYQTELANREVALKAQQEKWAAEKANYTKLIEADADRYFKDVQERYADQFAALTPEASKELTESLEHFELHVGLDLQKLGPDVLGKAIALAKDGHEDDIIFRLLKAEHDPGKQAQVAAQEARAKKIPRSPAASVIAGANGGQAPVPPSAPNIDKLPHHKRLGAIARRAIEAQKRR